MAGRTYPRLEIEPFGERLLTTGDLDPVYLALHRMALEPVVLNRWLLAYSCFYSAGFACYAAEREGPAFWPILGLAADNLIPTPFDGRWPRGHERRHARGAAAGKMVRGLHERYGDRPEDFVEACKGATCAEVMKKVKAHYLYGDWIAFKVADLLERVVGHPVSFSEAEVFMFDSPREAANVLYARRMGLAKVRLKPKGISAVVASLTKTFERFKAPPRFDRAVNLQEVETILCCWKSHLSGHYQDLNDIIEINEGLAPWLPHSKLSVQFADAMPTGALIQ